MDIPMEIPEAPAEAQPAEGSEAKEDTETEAPEGEGSAPKEEQGSEGSETKAEGAESG